MSVGRKRRERASQTEKEGVHDSQRFQKGYVFSRTTDRGTVHVIRYRVRSTDGKWRHKAETVDSSKRKDAERILAERLREVNRGLRLPIEISFSDFVSSHWETYASQNSKPSTQASHRSNVRTHLLTAFGKLRLSEISPLQIMNFVKEKVVAGLKPKSLLNLYVLLQKMLNPRGCLGTFEYESYTTCSEAQGGADREAFSFPGSSQGHCGQHA
jgi:hypothetical protein